MNLRMVVILLTVSIFLSDCGAQAQPPTNPGTVPNSLQTIEAAAEDIIDLAPGGNWDKIATDVTDITNAWETYRAQAGRDGASQELQNAMSSALADLQAASGAKDAAATMQASNNVSAAVVEMFALFNPKVPSAIGRLDVLERQVILDVAAVDYAAAETDLTKTKLVWEQVKPSVLDHNGKEVAAQFEASLTAQQSALDAQDEAALTSEARDGLEIVDGLERLY
jgi:hypothetical protein